MNFENEFAQDLEDGRLNRRIDALIDGNDPDAADQTEANPVRRSSSFTAWLKMTCLDAFVATYGFDGYNFATKKATYARTFSFDEAYDAALDSATNQQPVDNVDTAVLVASFFGAPSRPEAVVNDEDGKITATLSSDRATLNFFGGFDVVRHRTADPDHPTAMAWTEKDRWELLLSPIKATLLFGLKAVLFLPKLAFNIVKLFTEFLPVVLSTALSTAGDEIHERLTNAMNNKETYKKEFTVFGRKIVWTPLRGLAGLGFTFLWAPVYLISVASDILKILGRTFTSPEKSARLAFAEVRGALLRSDLFSRILFAGYIANIVGGIAAVLSIAISATLWAIALPLAFGAIASAFPAVLQVGATLALKFPAITAAIQSVLSFVGTLTATAFAPAFGAMTSFFGVSVSVATLTSTLSSAGITLGLVAIAVGSVLTASADALSNWWARWESKTGPLTSLCRGIASLSSGIASLRRSRTAAPSKSYIDVSSDDFTVVDGEERQLGTGVSLAAELLVRDSFLMDDSAAGSLANADKNDKKVDHEPAQRPQSPQSPQSLLSLGNITTEKGPARVKME